MECPSCHSGDMKPVEDVQVRVPGPGDEVVGGEDPQNFIRIPLPFSYCGECNTVVFVQPIIK
ncbi:hypothetical protein ACFL06_01405 [Patescibacteria group bacterium]